MFRVLGNGCDGEFRGYTGGGYSGGDAVQNAFGSGSMGGFGNPNPQGGGSSGRRYFAPAALDCPLVQAEMVLSYDVQ